MRDFTREIFRRLLESAGKNGYEIITYRDFISGKTGGGRILVLRHDVDDRPRYALSMATIEYDMKVKSSYYFRDRRKTFKPAIMKSIEEMGHEIGYHYENMSKCKGDEEMAFHDFETSLTKFREIVSVDTICSHGRPLSGFDNMSLWNNRDYKAMAILGDINLDTDFSSILYLTDTGRSWNSIYNRRDKVRSTLSCDVRTTTELIGLLEKGALPPVLFLNIHPQRWTDNILIAQTDRVSQLFKNAIKYFFFMKDKNDSLAG